MKLIRYEHPTITDFDRLFNWSLPAINRAFEPADTNRAPITDVQEDEQGYQVMLELPGIKKDNLDLTVDNGVLTVHAVSKNEEDAIKLSFKRVFKLPESVQPDKIAATLEDGVLKISLPKVEAIKPRKIKIK